MSTTTVERSWFGARGDAWAAFCLAMKDLDLTVEEVAPIELEDRGTIRCGQYRNGWFGLQRAWEVEPLIAQRLATRLGAPVERVVYQAWSRRAGSGVEFVAEGSGERIFPEGTRQPLPVPDEPAVSAETSADALADAVTLRELLRSFCADAAHEVMSPLIDPGVPTRSFRLRPPRGWQAPDRFTLAQRDGALQSRGALSLEAGGQRFSPPPASLPMVLFRWSEGGALDNDLPRPDLARWAERLLRRHGLAAPPAEGDAPYAQWATDWERLTRADRAAVGAGGRVPRWKLVEPGSWILSPAECALLAERLGRPEDPQQRAWAAAWAEFLHRATQGATTHIG